MIHEGNLKITKENQGCYKDLREVGGSVRVFGDVKLPKLETVGRFVHVYGNVKLPKLEVVGGSVHVYADAKLDAPNLEALGGSVRSFEGAKLPKLENVGGYVEVFGDAKLVAPKLENVGGYVDVFGDTKLGAPNLDTVGGSVYISADAKLVAPKLENVGGSIDVFGDTKLPKDIKSYSNSALFLCEINLNLSLFLKGMAIIDGILCYLLKEKQTKGLNVFTIRIVGKTKTSYVVQKGDEFSHGETVKQAIEDLRFKIGNRDKSEFECWRDDLDKQISLEDAIQGYRVITGACEYGVKDFLNKTEVPKKITPKVVMELTKNQYGNESLRSFLND